MCINRNLSTLILKRVLDFVYYSTPPRFAVLRGLKTLNDSLLGDLFFNIMAYQLETLFCMQRDFIVTWVLVGGKKIPEGNFRTPRNKKKSWRGTGTAGILGHSGIFGHREIKNPGGGFSDTGIFFLVSAGMSPECKTKFQVRTP